VALTITDVQRTVKGNKRELTATVLFDSSYPTGGEAVAASDFGLSSVDTLFVYPHASRIGVYDHTNQKILLYTALGTEATNASDQSTITVYVRVSGN